MSRLMSRRGLIASASAAGSLLLTGCDRLTESSTARRALDFGQAVTRYGQRLLLSGQPLVREFTVADISPDFPLNGTEMPRGSGYQELLEGEFDDWRLGVDGLVERPLSLSLEDLRAMPARTQITMHCCDEGWNAIGQWTGIELRRLLLAAGLKPEARYIVFHCMDEMVRSRDRSGFYYESLDLFDAFHPQTILAYGMNGQPLPVAHGAPLRLRVERQIGYKNAKYVTRVEAVDRLDRLGKGHGGFWEDRGFQWYAGL